MKKNELGQIKELDIKALRIKAKALKEEIAGLTMDKNMQKLKDLKMLSKKKKEMAQILTVIKQKELLQELESKVQKDSERLSEPENQILRYSDALSRSEFSEKPKRRLRKGVKK